MPPVVYQLAGGVYAVPATGTLAIFLALGGVARRRWAVLASVGGAVVAAAVIVVSAPALPPWLDVAWAVLVLSWLTTEMAGRRAIGRLTRTAAVAVTVLAGGLMGSYGRWHPLPPGHAIALCVIGDSISAGLGRPGETTWPALLRAAHGIRVVDLSHAGCTAHEAVGRSAAVAGLSGDVVVIEIGGNDLIGRTDPARFEADLDALVNAVGGPGRQVVLFEVPRFPFADAYGLAQRRVADRHGVRLVPRRLFAAVLAGPGATTDGVHLSAAGQQQMADLVWRTVGAAFDGR